MRASSVNLPKELDLEGIGEQQFEQSRALLWALLEKAICEETDAAKRLALAKDSLLALEKLNLAHQRFSLQKANTCSAEDIRQIMSMFVNAICDLVKNRLGDNALCVVADLLPVYLYRACVEDKRTRAILFDKHQWNKMVEQYGDGHAYEQEVVQCLEDLR